MSVFKSELNWSTYQDKQLKVLENIGKSIGNSLDISKSLSSTMDKVESAISSIAYASEVSAKNISLITKDLIGHSFEFIDNMDRAGAATESFSRSIEDTSDSIEEFGDQLEETGKGLASSIKGFMSSLYNELGGLKKIAEGADKFSEASNDMIKLSGMSGEAVREFRSSTMSIVDNLNKATGTAYSPLEAYRRLISISQGITSNLEAIKEMSRPLLLADEALDVDISNVAELFNRFYTRYSFSSSHMEETLDEIRGNTAGNSADAQATVENIAKLEGYINLIAKNDNELRQELMESISHYTSFYENLGVDSGIFTEYLKDIMGGNYQDETELINILSRVGISPTEATEMARSGDPEKLERLMEALLEGTAAIASTYEGAFNFEKAMANTGIDPDFAINALAAVESENYKDMESFLKDQSKKNIKSMEELVEDKYVSAMTRIERWLEKIHEVIAKIQEFLPFGLSDILTVIGLIAGLKGIGNMLSIGAGASALAGAGGAGAGGLLAKGSGLAARLIGSTGNAMVKGSGALGLLSSAGYNLVGGAATSTMSGAAAAGLGALGVAGTGLGLGLAYHGYKGLTDKSQGLLYRGLSGVELAGGATGAIGLGAGMLGVAAATPIGLAALAVGLLAGLTKLFTKKKDTTPGSAKLVASQYKELSLQLNTEIRDRKAYLGAISRELDDYEDIIKSNTATEEEKIQANQDLEEMRSRLIESGLLSEASLEEARTANIDGLQKLTDKYIEATGKFAETTNNMVKEYEQINKQAVIKQTKSLANSLNSLNYKDADQLAAADAFYYELYNNMSTMDKESMNSQTKQFYNALEEAMQDATLTASEASRLKIAGGGIAGTKVMIPAEMLYSAATYMRDVGANSYGEEIYDDIFGDIPMMYPDETKVVAEALGRIKDTPDISEKEAKEILDELESQGIDLSKYDKKLELVEEATGFDLSSYKEGDYEGYSDEASVSDFEKIFKGYATGSNYIERDQLAFIHEGEAVVPKKYNPAANSEEFKVLSSHIENSQLESKQEAKRNRETFNTFLEEMIEIKKLLSKWKVDSDRKTRTDKSKNRSSSSNGNISNSVYSWMLD